MNEPEWIDYDVVLAIHEAQLAEHGGLSGIRDRAYWSRHWPGRKTYSPILQTRD
jgi:hypothetical protein